MNIDNDCWRLQPERFISWTRLTRITAWTFRFINNCKQDDKVMQGELSSEEVMDAENYLIKMSQHEQTESIQGGIHSIDETKGNPQ